MDTKLQRREKERPERGGPRPDRISTVQLVGKSRLRIRFADGLSGTWTFRALELDASNLKLGTIKVDESGAAITAETKDGETVQLDPSWLRALVDRDYAAELEKALVALRGPLDKLATIPQRKKHTA